jgi:acetyl esterase/lipase
MSFADLQPLAPMIHAEANDYAAAATALSKRALNVCRSVLDIPYGADYWQRLDLFLPAAPSEKPLPVFAFVHGGAWMSGCKEWLGFMAPSFVGLPCLFVSISYRKAPQHRLSVQVADIIAALAWIAGNIGQYGGDPARLFVGGHSAGGNLAALAALRPDLLADGGVAADAIKGVLPLSASFDFRPDAETFDETMRQVHAKVLDDPNRAAELSPISHVANVRAPFLIAWGERDFLRTLRQGPAMVDALRRHGARVGAMVLAGDGHFDTSLRAANANSDWVCAALDLIADGRLPESGGPSARR